MIGMTGKDGLRPVDLLGKHDAGKPVGQDHGAERQTEIGSTQGLLPEPIGAADQKRQGLRAAVPIFGERLGEFLAAELFTLRLETNHGLRRAAFGQ